MALECLRLLLAEKAGTLSSLQDDIISGLVRRNHSVRLFFAAKLQTSVTLFFDEIYARGDAAAVCLDMVVLDPTLWPSDAVRSHCERELFQLFIAKLMESGHDLDGRSLKGITRLLVVDAASLHHLIDDESLEVVLSSSDNHVPMELRTQATLAMVKYLEASKDVGEKRFANLISAKLAKGRGDDVNVAYSAVASVFPVIPKVTSTLFLSKEFIDSLSSTSSKGRKSESIEYAMLELLNAACIDQNCRKAISKDFMSWLSHILSNGSERNSELAAVALTKIRASEKDTSSGRIQEADSSIPELVDRFKGLMSKKNVDNVENAVEGLAYSSVKPDVKEQLARDHTFLREFVQLVKSNSKDSSVLYGGLVVLMNLTTFLPKLSEEQNKMSQLKAYAEASGAEAKAGPNPLDDDKHVIKRCTAVTSAGVMPLLIECNKGNVLQSVRTLSSKILLSLSHDRKSRGMLAQQGAVKLLLLITSPKMHDADSGPDEASHDASHALARILISVNPSLVFPSSGFPQITSAIRPLVELLARPEQAPLSVEQPRDLLPVFESLLALTNLASSPDPTVPETIVRQAWSTVEDLLLSNNSMIQRAACELICNLVTCESGVVKFADGTKRASQRLRILLALTDAEDAATRSAAGGALAMLTDYDAVVTAIIDRPAEKSASDYIHEKGDGGGKAPGPRAVDLLLRLCQEEDGGLAYRGVVCVQNMINASGNTGPFAKELFKASNAAPILAENIKKTQASGNMDLLQSSVEVLKALVY